MYRIRTPIVSNPTAPDIDLKAETREEAERRMLTALHTFYSKGGHRRRRVGFISSTPLSDNSWKLEYGRRTTQIGAGAHVDGYVILYANHA